MKKIVRFDIDGVTISTLGGMPDIQNKDGKRIITINNALDDIKKKIGVDLRDLTENIYLNAKIEDGVGEE